MIENEPNQTPKIKIDCKQLINNALLQIEAEVSSEKRDLLVRYLELLLEWNSKINLISRKSEEFVLSSGLIESFSLYEFLQNFSGRMLDVGSGGGIPGIFIAILFSDNPDYHFTLIDSIGKKMMVLNDIKQQLGLTNVTIFNTRLEDIKKFDKIPFDLIFSRGVGSFDEMLKAYYKALSDEGIIVFLTGIDQAEAACFKEARIFPNPYLENRLLVIMEKN